MTEIKSIAVVGLGYVGLPLALLAEEKGFEVIGLDIDERKIDSLKKGKSYIDDVSDSQVAASRATYSNDFSLIGKTEATIICVPTPVTEKKEPDLSPVKGAVTASVPHMKDGSLLVIESTINPGVCDEVVIPLIEKITSKKVGEQIYLAHCPERINPGDPKWNVRNINRVIGANSKQELDMAVALYESIIEAQIKPMGSIKEAEACKVVENSFRDINIAFVNELAMSFHKLGINVENVIEGAATKPFAFMPHHPGVGVGGHCIPVDPYYLIEYAHSYGFEHEFLRLARSINESMPQFTVDILTEALNEVGHPIKGTKITMLGLSYKADIGDDRESPAHTLRKLLEDAEADLTVFDPYILSDSTVKTFEEAVKDAEAIVVATGHREFKEFDYTSLARANLKVIVDGRNVLRTKKDELVKSQITYKGIGV